MVGKRKLIVALSVAGVALCSSTALVFLDKLTGAQWVSFNQWALGAPCLGYLAANFGSKVIVQKKHPEKINPSSLSQDPECVTWDLKYSKKTDV